MLKKQKTIRVNTSNPCHPCSNGKKTSFVLILALLTTLAWGSRVVPLPGKQNPDSVTVQGDLVYITDGVTISIYKDDGKKVTLLKTFGKQGEGPREFRVPMSAVGRLNLFAQPGLLVVNSVNRVSLFSPDGQYRKEIQTATGRKFMPLGKGYVAYASVNENKTLFLTINFHDDQLRKTGEIFRKDYYVQPNKPFNLPKLGIGNNARAIYTVAGGKLYVMGAEDIIHVFDEKCKKAYDIPLKYDKLSITEAQKKQIRADLDVLLPSKTMQRLLRSNGFFPAKFPARLFTVADDKIYVPTHRKKGDKSEIIIFDTHGKEQKRVYLPFYDETLLLPCPYSFGNNRLYQIYDNEETEEWELHIHEINP